MYAKINHMNERNLPKVTVAQPLKDPNKLEYHYDKKLSPEVKAQTQRRLGMMISAFAIPSITEDDDRGMITADINPKIKFSQLLKEIDIAGFSESIDLPSTGFLPIYPEELNKAEFLFNVWYKNKKTGKEQLDLSSKDTSMSELAIELSTYGIPGVTLDFANGRVIVDTIPNKSALSTLLKADVPELIQQQNLPNKSKFNITQPSKSGELVFHYEGNPQAANEEMTIFAREIVALYPKTSVELDFANKAVRTKNDDKRGPNTLEDAKAIINLYSEGQFER